MATKITVDPITRIEGHLRIDVEVEGGSITNAWASPQMWRGIEVILKGRDPRDAWAFCQRICGVCTTVHAIASVRTVENALGIGVPINAQYIRNIILCAHAMHDHIVHFYQLSALDWVDVVSALDADPGKTAELAQSLSPWPDNGKSRFEEVKEKLQALVASGQLGPFQNGYWGHPAMKLPPEANLMAVSHYLQALDYQRKADQVAAIFGGKNPHIQTVIVGGVALAINLDNLATLNMDKLMQARQLLEEVRQFVHQVYLPDVIAIGALYKNWLAYGKGVTNYLAVPDLPLDSKGTVFDMPGGTIFGSDLKDFTPITSFDDRYFRDNVAESIVHSWYEGDWTRHPWNEETVPDYTDFNEKAKYSWAKAPRFKGQPMQVGPLACVLVGYVSGDKTTREWVDMALKKVSAIAGAEVGVNALQSTPGRHLARAIRAAMIADYGLKHLDLLVKNIGMGDLEIYPYKNPPTFPKGEIRGFGFHEAPRGALSHWIVIQDGRIKNYQCVVPSTWNVSPRCSKDFSGPYESSLMGNPIAQPEKPLEVLRTVHSFDPCIACAVHLLDPEKREFSKVKVL